MLISMDSSSSRYLLDARCRYRIFIRGALDSGWSDRLGGMTVLTTRRADGTAATTLSGELADQSALVGVLNILHDFGIPLMAMERIDDEAEDRTVSLPAEQKD
jgi:hypothetical protein